MVLIGAHLHGGDPLPEARARDAAIVQIFLGDPQGWKAPPDRSADVAPQHAAASAKLGARGLIVHGGHLNKGDDPEEGFANWRKTVERAKFDLPILIENTAGGDNAMARRLDRLARLWDAVGDFGPGFCLDTCHAHAGGEELIDLVDKVKAITGRIDLVHANGSRDSFGSGADRHANLTDGHIDPDAVVAVCAAAGSPGRAAARW